MNPRNKIREKVLAAKLNAGDSDAYADVYNDFVERIYRYIYFKVSHREEAEDLTSEVFIRGWEYVYRYKKRIGSLNAFFYQIARNVVVDFYRRQSRIDIINDAELMKKIHDSRQQKLLAEIENEISLNEIGRILKTLKEEYREVILLRYVEELSISEISEILNRSKGAVRILIHRAMDVLKKSMKNQSPDFSL